MCVYLCIGSVRLIWGCLCFCIRRCLWVRAVCMCVVCLGFCVIAYGCHMSVFWVRCQVCVECCVSAVYLGVCVCMSVQESLCSCDRFMSVTSVWVPVGARPWAGPCLQTHPRAAATALHHLRQVGVGRAESEPQGRRLSPASANPLLPITQVAPEQQEEPQAQNKGQGSAHLPSPGLAGSLWSQKPPWKVWSGYGGHSQAWEWST